MLGKIVHLLDDVQHNCVAFINLRRYFQGHTHALALNGLKRILRAIPHAGIGVGACHKGHLLADRDVGLLVVQREQTGGGQHVGIALGFQRIEDHGHGQGFVNNTPSQGGARDLRESACHRPRVNVL